MHPTDHTSTEMGKKKKSHSSSQSSNMHRIVKFARLISDFTLLMKV